jgi:histidinol-phosphate aminotransferase
MGSVMAASRRTFFRAFGTGVAGGLLVSRRLQAAPAASLFGPARAQVSDAIVRLDQNENAYGPSWGVRAAISNPLDLANRYVYSQAGLMERIAAFHGVKPEQVLLGNGSSEILRAAPMALLRPGKKCVQASPLSKRWEATRS